MPCQNLGTCIEEIDGYTCSCVAGFTGDHCESGTCLCILRLSCFHSKFVKQTSTNALLCRVKTTERA